MLLRTQWWGLGSRARRPLRAPRGHLGERAKFGGFGSGPTGRASPTRVTGRAMGPTTLDPCPWVGVLGCGGQPRPPSQGSVITALGPGRTPTWTHETSLTRPRSVFSAQAAKLLLAGTFGLGGISLVPPGGPLEAWVAVHAKPLGRHPSTGGLEMTDFKRFRPAPQVTWDPGLGYGWKTTPSPHNLDTSTWGLIYSLAGLQSHTHVHFICTGSYTGGVDRAICHMLSHSCFSALVALERFRLCSNHSILPPRSKWPLMDKFDHDWHRTFRT